MFNIDNYFDLTKSISGEYLKKYNTPWDVIPHIDEIIKQLIKNINKNDFNIYEGNVYIHKTCKVNKFSTIVGPCIIGKDTEIRQAAFIRGDALIGENCVIGNSCEIKNSIIFNEAQIPHFNYVGDSIIGYKSHLGAGAITSNLRSDKALVTIRNGEELIKTNLQKLGAIVGDETEVGCNTVLNPGSVIGKHTIIYPLSFVRGVVKENSIYKNMNEIEKR